MLLQFKELIRNKQNKPFTFIVNSVGMILAFTVVTVIFCHTYSELNHDSNVKHRNNIVRIEVDRDWGLTPGAYGPWLAETCPEVSQFCRIWKETLSVHIPAKENIRELIIEEEVLLADSTYPAMFSLQFLRGNIQAGPDNAILSQSTARRLFGETDPLGKQLILNNKINLTVTGIFKDVTNPALYNPKIIVSPHNSQLWTSQALDQWLGNNFETYLHLNSKSSREQIAVKFKQRYAQRLSEIGKLEPAEITAKLKDVSLRDYSDLYFNPLLVESCNHGNLSNVKILILISILVLFVSIINYVNIATAKVADQSQKIRLKRTLGARRFSLIHSIILDAVATCFIAMSIAFFIAWTLSPYLENWIGLSGISGISLVPASILLLIIPIVCGILSGIFPAIYLTRINNLTSNNNESITLQRFKSGLITVQFAISLGLIISTLFIYKQVNYVKTLNPGYDRSNVITIYTDYANNNLGTKYSTFRTLLLQNPQILNVGISLEPIHHITYSEFNLPITGWEKGMVPVTLIDNHLLDLLGLEVIEKTKTEASQAFKYKTLVNEQMAKAISSLSSPSQNYLEENSNDVAIVKDFNYKSMHEAIGPMYMTVVANPEKLHRGYIYIRITPEQRDKSLAHIKNCYDQLYPNTYYRYGFMDDDYNRLYHSEVLFANQLITFAGLSIAIACLGLLAFTAFFIEQNTKNIGIRKVVGATEMQVLNLLNRDILIRLLIAFLISSPIAYYLISKWLMPFAYKTELSWWIFAGAFIIMVCLALLSVSSLTWKAATSNPVDLLKDE